ncbi:MAG: uroporphyrinogen-III synthase [Prevotellaceae bacterium]|nr:uroporphyrinogen-III synthase [Prevotellaceae bacterium]
MVKRILVSQPKPDHDKSPYFDLEKEFGVECVFRPFFKVEGITSKAFREQRVSLADYSAVIFTSRHAIDNFFSLAKEMRIVIPETMKYFCVIEKIALYIQKYVQYRKRKVFFGATGKVDDLMPQIVKHKDEKYLVPLSGVHNDDIKNLLDSKGIQHRECVMYNTVSNDFSEEEKAAFNYDMLLFFSPTGVKALKKNFPDFQQGDIKIGAFGPATAKAVKDEGLRLDLEAPNTKHHSMTGALKEYLQGLQGEE